MLLAASSYSPAEQGSPRVLMLFSNDRLLPANQRYDEGMRRALEPKEGQSAVNIFGEFLDATRLGGEDREEALEEYLRRRYRDFPPDVVVALGPEALKFLVDRRESLFPAVPLVFGGTSVEELKTIPGLSGATGLPMEMSILPMVEALLTMRPKTREILLVHGAAATDRKWRDVAIKQLASLKNRVNVTDFPELSVPELKLHLAKITPDKAVVYLTYFQGPGGETHTPAHMAAEIAAAAAAPVVGPYDTYVGSGVLGVCVSPFEDEGRLLGKLIRRVLEGERPDSIGVLPPSKPHFILDERQVKRWRIDTLPKAAEMRFRKPTLWQEHPNQVLATIAVVSLQGLLISGLLIARARQRRTQKELESSEERFSGVFRRSPAAISILRRSDGCIVDVNPGWEFATGLSRADALGRTPLQAGMVVSGDSEGRFRQFLASGKLLRDYEQAHRMPDGRVRILSLSTESVTFHAEPCYIIVAKDVTELREVENLRQQLAHASRLSMLGEMTASIAHEINQPLGAILSNTDAAEMLLKKQSPPPLNELSAILADIRKDNHRAYQVIERVRAMVNHRRINRVTLDLNDLLLECLRLVTQEGRRKGVTLSRELRPGLPPVQADAVQIQQVMLNLLANAMDAMEASPLAGRKVVVSTSVLNNHLVRVSVEDRGPGIAPENLERVFDWLFTTKEHGMGLGLALARSIAEVHGGSLHAEINASNGATFHLTLPIVSSSE